MIDPQRYPRLSRIALPEDLRQFPEAELPAIAEELRAYLVDTVSSVGGHFGAGLGVIELTLALHRVFDSPRDIILWDTGHQAYVHKLVTGRFGDFDDLRQPGGLSGYPCRAESAHDWIENSHASTVLSYAHGIDVAQRVTGQKRRVVAVMSTFGRR